jgi:hypothetical protein
MTEPPASKGEFVAWLASLPAEERERQLVHARTLAIAAAPDDEVLEKPPVRTLGEYLDTPLALPPMLVEPGQLARGAVTALIARGGKGKTTMTLNRLLRWSIGKPMFAEREDIMVPVAPLKVLVIENEGAPGFFQEKLALMTEQLEGEDRALARENVLVWGEGGWPRLKLDHEGDRETLQRALDEHRPDVLFMEPFRSLHRGEENSSTDMQLLMDTIADLAAEYGAGVLLTHHENKGGPGDDGEQMTAARGSTVLEADSAVMERYKQVRANVSELSWIKTRFGNRAAPVRMEFQWETWGYRYVPEEESWQAVLTVLAGANGVPLSVSEISEEVDESQAAVRKTLKTHAEDDPRIRVHRSVSTGAGSTGKRYQLVLDEDDDDGGLPL